MHEEELDVTGVLDEEGLVAGGHHVLGLLVATISDLHRQNTLVLDLILAAGIVMEWNGMVSTEGMGMLLLKRLRTRLSIPLGLRHDEGTHLKRSDWWRQKVLVPVQRISLMSSGSFFLVLVLHPSAWLWSACSLSVSFLSSLCRGFFIPPLSH